MLVPFRSLLYRFAVVPLVACALGATIALLAPLSCGMPSSELDGGDLLGVFSRDAAADAGPDAARRDARRRDAAPDGSAAPSPLPPAAPLERVPTEGVCVAEAGQPNREIRQTLGRPACRGAQVLEWKDAEGAPRYACVFAPPGVETRAPLPLVIFFHSPEDDPTAVAKKTGLHKLAATHNLTGDASHTGFLVLAPQGRALKRGKHGAIFETEYTGPDNIDVATVEHFIAELDGKGLVDKRRIFALGDGLGGQMAATFAMMRADRVAAFAAFATDAPRAAWSCPGPPPPAMVIYRACDSFVSCESVERWLRVRDAAGAQTAWLRLGASAEEEPNCAVKNKCTPLKGEIHHRRWPKPREADLLQFFARHALRGP